jgi:hypothetical protein
MVLPPFCIRVTAKAGPTPINLTIHAPFLTNLFTWIGIAFCITQSANKFEVECGEQRARM